MSGYYIPAQRQRFETEVKRSRFITSFDHIRTRDEAKFLLADLKKEFPDANHHCWAMILGGPTDSHGQDQSDDGEPKGTAGKPMLNVLQHSGLGHVMVIVTRYFGGIKLGAGGLVRAYSSAVSAGVKELDTVEYLILDELTLSLPYSLLDTLKHRLIDTRARITNEIFTDAIVLTLEFPEDNKNKLLQMLETVGHGKIILHSD